MKHIGGYCLAKTRAYFHISLGNTYSYIFVSYSLSGIPIVFIVCFFYLFF